MASPIRISLVRLVPAPPATVRTGLLAWASCTVADSLRLDGIAVRRAEDGRILISYPTRRDRAGRQHSYFLPLNERVRSAIESRLLREAEEQGLIERAQRRSMPSGAHPASGRTRYGPAGSDRPRRPPGAPRRAPRGRHGPGPSQKGRPPGTER